MKNNFEVDIYDFDKTVLPYDSGSLFWGFCLLRNPWIVICVPYQFFGGILFLLRIIDLTVLKKYFFCFVRMIDVKKNVDRFWKKYEPKIYPWFRKENRARHTVVISASPDFLLESIAEQLEVETLICTRHDLKNGAVIGQNCKGDEKVKRFRQEMSDCRVIDVYSDSTRSDRPIFSLGENCFHIVKGQRNKFNYNEKYK